MNGIEIVLNLWFVQDEDNIIYSLRVKAYVVKGTDEEKIAFLHERAMLDYLIAEPFQIPERFHTIIQDNNTSTKMPVVYKYSLTTPDNPVPITLFEDAIKKIEERFPYQSSIGIPKNLLVVSTPLMQNEDGKIEPFYTDQISY
jgi:transcription initiation factor IIF auxiliary subunit